MMEPTTRTCCWRWPGRRPFLMSLSTRHTLVVVIKQCRWELFLCEQLLCFMCYCTVCPKSCNIVRQTLCALSKLVHCLDNYIIPFFFFGVGCGWLVFSQCFSCVWLGLCGSSVFIFTLVHSKVPFENLLKLSFMDHLRHVQCSCLSHTFKEVLESHLEMTMCQCRVGILPVDYLASYLISWCKNIFRFPK